MMPRVGACGSDLTFTQLRSMVGFSHRVISCALYGTTGRQRAPQDRYEAGRLVSDRSIPALDCWVSDWATGRGREKKVKSQSKAGPRLPKSSLIRKHPASQDRVCAILEESEVMDSAECIGRNRNRAKLICSRIQPDGFQIGAALVWFDGLHLLSLLCLPGAGCSVARFQFCFLVCFC